LPANDAYLRDDTGMPSPVLSDHPVDVGQRSEAAILAAFVDRGFLVWLPWGTNHRADMLLEGTGGLLRIQCKTGRLRRGRILFRPQSVRCNTKQIVTRSYLGEVEYFAVYCPETRGVYMVPCDETTRSHVTLRVQPAANHQSKGIRWAGDYALERFTP
jgi:PD-(D/E)XK endonuclease